MRVHPAILVCYVLAIALAVTLVIAYHASTTRAVIVVAIVAVVGFLAATDRHR